MRTSPNLVDNCGGGANDNLTLSVGGFKNLNEYGGSFEAQIWYTFGSRRQESQPVPPPTEPVSP